MAQNRQDHYSNYRVLRHKNENSDNYHLSIHRVHYLKNQISKIEDPILKADTMQQLRWLVTQISMALDKKIVTPQQNEPIPGVR